MTERSAVTGKEKNARGIPHAPFVEDVEKYLGGPDVDVEPTLRKFQDALAKYRYMESNLSQRRIGLEEKLPDLKKSLAMVEYLQERREGKASRKVDDDDLDDDIDPDENGASYSKSTRITFELNDTLYAEADLEETDSVHIWLGANTMLSYRLPEAIDLLRSKVEVAEKNCSNLISDLEYLKEQVTIMEVNTARVYNWDVKRRREIREKEAASSKFS